MLRKKSYLLSYVYRIYSAISMYTCIIYSAMYIVSTQLCIPQPYIYIYIYIYISYVYMYHLLSYVYRIYSAMYTSAIYIYIYVSSTQLLHKSSFVSMFVWACRALLLFRSI